MRAQLESLSSGSILPLMQVQGHTVSFLEPVLFTKNMFGVFVAELVLTDTNYGESVHSKEYSIQSLINP